MKLAMFRPVKAEEEKRPGVVLDGARIVDVAALFGKLGQKAPGDVLEIIEGGDEVLAVLRKGLARPEAKDEQIAFPLDRVRLLAPLDPPRGNVLAIGRNYEKHASESARAWGEQVKPPTVFTKAQLSVAGPYDDIAIDPKVSDKLDWEVELGIVIGRRGVNIKQQEALRHVFGYTVINDVSARDIQHDWGGQFFKGKSLDRSSPVGPWVVTADEIADPQKLRLILRLNGEVKQDASTGDMIHSVADLVVWLSKGMTLLPGTLIASGTPDGVGFARNPPEFLKPGDLMETEVEKVGSLRNRIVKAT